MILRISRTGFFRIFSFKSTIFVGLFFLVLLVPAFSFFLAAAASSGGAAGQCVVVMGRALFCCSLSKRMWLLPEANKPAASSRDKREFAPSSEQRSKKVVVTQVNRSTMQNVLTGPFCGVGSTLDLLLLRFSKTRDLWPTKERATSQCGR